MKNVCKFVPMLVAAAAVLAVPAFAGAPGNLCIYNAPEPSSLAMLATGLGGVIALRHWRKR